jgi:hypothetical protein
MVSAEVGYRGDFVWSHLKKNSDASKNQLYSSDLNNIGEVRVG